MGSCHWKVICQTITLLFTVKGEQYFALCYPEMRMLLQDVVCGVCCLPVGSACMTVLWIGTASGGTKEGGTTSNHLLHLKGNQAEG